MSFTDGLDFGQNLVAHLLALVVQRGLRLAFKLVNGRAALLQLLELVRGGLFAAVALFGGNGLVVGLLQKLLVFVVALFANRPYVFVVLGELGGVSWMAACASLNL